MTRLPTPGADANNWGEILNDFLSVELNSDGTLKTAGSLASKADDTAVIHSSGDEVVAGTKTFNSSPVVPTPTLSTQAANKSYVDSTMSAGTPDATTSAKGIVQLTGDLSGTASAPTVPGLASKEPAIIAGTAAQYWRGDKTWQTLPTAPVTSVNAQTGAVTLTKSDVGLANVDNTSDANKPVSTAQAAADSLRVLKSGDTMTGDLGVIGNYTLKDNATATKSYRFRTSGSSLDFETAGARMYFSAWDNANFTGMQHNYYAVDIYSFQATNHWYWKTSIDGTNVFDIDTGSSLMNVGDGVNLTLGTTTGTKIGTSTSQKLAFYNSTPIVRPSGNALTALSSLGLVATPTLAASDVGLGNVDNTSDATKNAATATLTNKRIAVRTGTIASSATPAINTDNYDEYDITALATNITSMTTNLSGSPMNGDELMLRFKDDGTPRTITWGTSFVSSGVTTLLATTAANKTHYVKVRYDSTAAKWVCLAVDAVGY